MLLLTHGFRQREINQRAAGYEYSGSDGDCSCCFYTLADRKHSKDPAQFKLRLLDRAGNPSSVYSRSNNASFQVQQAHAATRRRETLQGHAWSSPFKLQATRYEAGPQASATAPRLPRSNQALVSSKNIKHTLCFICNPAAMDDIVLQSRRSSPCSRRHQRAS